MHQNIPKNNLLKNIKLKMYVVNQKGKTLKKMMKIKNI